MSQSKFLAVNIAGNDENVSHIEGKTGVLPSLLRIDFIG
jgi:hypothetical protein